MNRKGRKACVCDYCLQAIESHDGRQKYTVEPVDAEDVESCLVCEWCGESFEDGMDKNIILNWR